MSIEHTLLKLATISLVGFSMSQAQFVSNATATSYREARRIVELAVAAHGGTNQLKLAERFLLREAGTAHMLFQSVRPEPPFDQWPIEEFVIMDVPRKLVHHEYKLLRPNSDYLWWVKIVLRDNEGEEAVWHKKIIVPLLNPSLSNFDGLLRRLPQNVISEALDRASSLRSLGKSEFEGRDHEVVQFTPINGPSLSLYLDSKTHLLTKYEYIYTRNTVGDATREFIFEGYRNENGMILPTRRVIKDAGYKLRDLDWVDVRLNHQASDTAFVLRGDALEIGIEEPRMRVTRLSDGVYVLEDLPGGYNILFVEFSKFVVVVETPEDDSPSGLSENVIATVKQTIPGKPIRYAVPTHHHSDHASGARAFMAEGSTILVAPSHVHFFEQLAAAPYTLVSDALARNPRKIKIESVKDKKTVIYDDRQILEIHEIGPTDHSKEILVTYLPNQGILYQSDLFNPIVPGRHPVTNEMIWHGVQNNSTIALGEAIKRLGLQVKTIIGSHGRLSTMGELAERVEQLTRGQK